MIRQVMSGGGGGLPGVKLQVTCAENSTELPLTGYSGSADDIKVILVDLPVATIAGMPEAKVVGRIFYGFGAVLAAWVNDGTSMPTYECSFSQDPLRFKVNQRYQFKGTYDVTVYTK